jgi:arylformamidase
MSIELPIVRGGLPISGIYDLEPIRLSYLNEKLRLDPAEAKQYSPLLLFPATAPELLIAYGMRELPELRRQSVEYSRAWSECGLPARLLAIEEANHFTILEALANPKSALLRAMLGVMEGSVRLAPKP